MKLTKKQKKQLVSLVLGIVVVLLGGNLLNQPQMETITKQPIDPGFYRVNKVNDGDTITVDMGGTAEKIRFIGVDTPETHHPSKPVQCFGEAAAKFTMDLIGDKGVRLESDPLNDNRDRYDRLLRYVYLPDGKMVNTELVKQGYGFAYTSFPLEKADEFERLETEARNANRGLWGGCDIKTNKYGDPESPPAK
ncbi:thermonuclease family protein [Candidatus Saccharibacteria bacterium]|jgi:endonuclease YncB( thermonuclease family)|nr:thermonuclease family protein [Candidatus Saccharibacteria bacterium]MBP9131655.1 thermonuclease family protein [Candidatus Saccharibacteria bacterium]